MIFSGFVIAHAAVAGLGGNRYGPRYYFDAFPLLIVSVVTVLPSLAARLTSPARALLPISSLAFVLYLLATWPLVLIGFSREVRTREEPFRLAAEARLSNAIVILGASGAGGLDASDLVRNSPSMDGEVLYVRSSGDIDAVHKAFPTRSIWRYSRPDPSTPGQIIRIAP
jgi:hypothetical protein